MDPFHDFRGITGMSVTRPMQYYRVQSGIPDPVDVHASYWSTSESLYQVQPVPPPSPSITYVWEMEEMFRPAWIADRVPTSYFLDLGSSAMESFHDFRGITSMSVTRPMQYYRVQSGIPDLVDAHDSYWSTSESLYQLQPVPPPSPSITYVWEMEEMFRPAWIADREPFYHHGVIEGPAETEVVGDPMTGRPITLLSQYNRMNQPYMLPPPISQVHTDDAVIQRTSLHRVPEEMHDDSDNLPIDVDTTFEDLLWLAVMEERFASYHEQLEMLEANEDRFINVVETYEQWLELEERIGSVSRGLSEKTIAAHVNWHKFHSPNNASATDSEAAELCCICQEGYVNGDELGSLECRHEFHYNCIKQWLTQKNECPLCKRTGVKI